MTHLTPELQKKIDRSAKTYMKERYATGYSPDKNYCMHFGPGDMEAIAVSCATKYALLAERLKKALEWIAEQPNSMGVSADRAPKGQKNCWKKANEAIEEYRREVGC